MKKRKNEINRPELISQLLFSIGEDPSREGLKETPLRVHRAYSELFSGYAVDVPKIFKVFSEKVIPDNQLILLKNIQFSSMCEHHMMPFVGTAHIAYIPRKKGSIVGVSKLVRVLDAYTKRLQIQERIGEQVTRALMDNLDPLGSACILKAKHFCISNRGVSEQQSEFVTSSLKGCFLKEADTRQELYDMIGV